ncbi:MAG: ferrous iron transport protein A [Chloroflexota bacterium]|nr:MAG: ferrous iron transport protein A [Chloroflexota bacterium]
MQTLVDVPTGAIAIVQQFQGGREFAARAAALGFTLGVEITVIHNYGSGPILVGVRGARVALGRGEASKIRVTTL